MTAPSKTDNTTLLAYANGCNDDDLALMTRENIDLATTPGTEMGMGLGALQARHPKETSLVYIAAFAPDKDESVSTLIADPPPEPPSPRSSRPTRASSSWTATSSPTPSPATWPRAQAEFMADSQVPWGVDALDGTVSQPAWRSKPSWYLIATDDRMIPPRPSTRCRSGSLRRPSRSPAATPSTSRNPTPSPT